jgi:hypothetical protein
MLKSSKKELNILAKKYKFKKAEFDYQHQKLLKEFKLSKNEKKEVAFGILIPHTRSLKEYTDILNSDLELIRLADEFREIFLIGCLIIINLIKERNIRISGYNINAFVNNPKENFYEIENLIQGLHGYKHIHLINEKIALEIPARNYLLEHSDLLKLVDFWVKKLDIFVYD